MPQEISLIKINGCFHPASSHDAEIMASWKEGQAIRVEATQLKDRSILHHRLYFAGLLTLAMDFWEPQGGLVGVTERSVLVRFARWLDSVGGDTGAVVSACSTFLEKLADSRSANIQSPSKDKQALHEWVKIEAGYFRYVITPNGIKKEPLSINFNAMDQDAFNDFYKAAFSVIWKFILSRTFSNEDEAQNAVDQLMAMG
jgi:hypothetical protein